MKLSFLSLFFILLAISCVGTDKITIDKPVVSLEEKVVIVEPSQALLVGGEAVFTANYTNTKGEIENVVIEWGSTNDAIASVTSEGLVTAKLLGGVFITANYGDLVSSPVTLNVVESNSELAIITTSGTEDMLGLGELTVLTAQGFDLEANEIKDLEYEWVSLDKSIATINENGEVTASLLNTGIASFYSTLDGLMSNVYTIEVFDRTKKLVRNGVFKGYGGYLVAGRVSLERQAGGDLILKFAADFISAQGPGLVVYLSNSNTEIIKEGIELQPLSQLSEAFEINVSEIYPNVGIKDYQYVIIHCKRFNVRFGGAQLGVVE